MGKSKTIFGREDERGRQARAGIGRKASPGLIGVLSWTLVLAPIAARPVRAEDTPPSDATRAATATLMNLQEAFAAVADELEPAVVTVFSTKSLRGSGDGEGDLPHGLIPFDRGPRRATGTGTGIIIRKDGWILTNDHVVGGADKVMVRLHDGREFT